MGWIAVKFKAVTGDVLAGVGIQVSSLLASGLSFVIPWN